MIKLTSLTRYRFGFKKFFDRILTAVHRGLDKEDDRRDLVEKHNSQPLQPKTLEESQKAMSQIEKEVSVLEKRRLQNIDEVLGTRTHFHETKYYQQRLDSEHIMEIKRIKRKYLREEEKSTGWIQDPQRPEEKFVIRNRKNYIKKLDKLRQYPLHNNFELDFSDDKDPNTLEFLAKEVLYTSMSMAEIDEAKKTFLDEPIQVPDDLIYSEKYVYFKREEEAAFVRANKTTLKKYGAVGKIPRLETEYLLTVQEIYEALLKLDQDPRVASYIARIENQELEYLLDRLIWSSTERYIAAVIDVRLKSGEPEHCIVVKDIVTDKVFSRVFLDIQPDAIIYGNSLLTVQRDELGLYTEVASFNLQNESTRLLYKCT